MFPLRFDSMRAEMPPVRPSEQDEVGLPRRNAMPSVSPSCAHQHQRTSASSRATGHAAGKGPVAQATPLQPWHASVHYVVSGGASTEGDCLRCRAAGRDYREMI